MFVFIRMLDRLKRESHEHDDMVNQLHNMQDNVHYTFFECFLTLAGQYQMIPGHPRSDCTFVASAVSCYRLQLPEFHSFIIYRQEMSCEFRY